MIALYPYVEIDRDGTRAHILATEPWRILESISELSDIWRDLDHRLELAIVIDGEIKCFI